MKNFLKIVSVYVGAFFFLAQRACVAYIWLLFKSAFICIPNTGRHIRIVYIHIGFIVYVEEKVWKCAFKVLWR
jgi:hypothetical protein